MKPSAAMDGLMSHCDDMRDVRMSDRVRLLLDSRDRSDSSPLPLVEGGVPTTTGADVVMHRVKFFVRARRGIDAVCRVGTETKAVAMNKDNPSLFLL
jgi:hypothetical protein